ncbi:J domain-containing protein [Mesorhizobium carmichaelinearum]|uniref:J domain-containing protein n=1 Tax=Mesorhizobium carmichaelinearum TaxID=1208188 RepID=UPI000BA3A316|nr:J domain-containing protein [Mesorhizobium carmichaelinearum]
MKSASEILTIRPSDARSLFPGDAIAIRKAYRQLAAAWHPDHCCDKRAAQIFAHLTSLREAALRIVQSARPTLRERTYHAAGAKTCRMRFYSEQPGPLGDVLVGRSHVVYEAPEAFGDIVEAEAANIRSLAFAGPEMAAEMKRFLPAFDRVVARSGIKASVLDKPRDAVLLGDLLRYMGGRLEPVHVAWIVSGMLNLASYLHWRGLAHCAIACETVFVDPQSHAVMLIGGWGFATHYGARPAAIPERTAAAIPRLMLKGELASPDIDLGLIRATACDLLATPGGGGLVLAPDIPSAMRDWLLLPPAQHAYEDYTRWQECLARSFGLRKFVPFSTTAADIYRQKTNFGA